MSVKTLENPETKSCESCGAQFSCGAASENCWCFEIKLNPRTLEKLRENYKNCLCADCLKKKNTPPIDTN
jgi:hypothetical protein